MQDTFSATSKRDVTKTCGPKDISSNLEIIYFPTPTAARNKITPSYISARNGCKQADCIQT